MRLHFVEDVMKRKLRAHAALDASFDQIAVQCREIEPAVIHSKRVRYNIVNLFPLIYNFLSFLMLPTLTSRRLR